MDEISFLDGAPVRRSTEDLVKAGMIGGVGGLPMSGRFSRKRTTVGLPPHFQDTLMPPRLVLFMTSAKKM